VPTCFGTLLADSRDRCPDIGKHPYGTAAVNRTRDGWLLFATETQGMAEYERGAARVLLDPGTIPNSPTAVT
jgi:hypothetical protein